MSDIRLGRATRIAITVTLYVLLVSGSAAPAAAPTIQLTHPRGDFVEVHGLRLWYESEGQGDPLLLIAGGPGFSHTYFHPFFSGLADSYRVIYFDAFGCGKSARAQSPSAYSMALDVETI